MEWKFSEGLLGYYDGKGTEKTIDWQLQNQSLFTTVVLLPTSNTWKHLATDIQIPCSFKDFESAT
jgi:hypothetical protein